MQIQQIRNATLRITYQNKNFLIDPMFAPQNTYPPITDGPNPDLSWPLTELPCSAETICQDIDAVIVTHYHIDHFDEYAAQALDKELPVFVQDEYDKNMLEALGFTNLNVINTEGTVFGDITLYKTPCLHGDAEKSRPYYDAYKIRGDAMGVIFTGKEENTLYLAGDTVFFDGVKKTIDKFDPYAIIINCAGAQFTGSGPIIMNTDDLLALHKYQPNLRIIASHLDTVGHATVSSSDLKKFVDDNNIENAVAIPENSESILLPTYAETMHNKAVARRFYALLNLKQYDEAAKLIHEDFLYWPQPDVCLKGAQAFMELERSNMDPCGDYKMRTKFIIAEDDRVAVYLTFEGTVIGDTWHDIPINNKHSSLDFMCMLRFKDGKIIEKRSKYDKYYILKKLAVDNLPPLY